jgi:hypothetical protein
MGFQWGIQSVFTQRSASQLTTPTVKVVLKIDVVGAFFNYDVAYDKDF